LAGQSTAIDRSLGQSLPAIGSADLIGSQDAVGRCQRGELAGRGRHLHRRKKASSLSCSITGPTGPTGPGSLRLNSKSAFGRPFSWAGFACLSRKTGPAFRPNSLHLTVKRIAVDRLQPACLPVLLLRVHVILSLHGRAAGGGVGGRRCRLRRRTRHRRCGGRHGAGGPGRLPGPPHHRAGASTRRQPGAGCWRRRWCWRSPWARPCPPWAPPPASPLFAVPRGWRRRRAGGSRRRDRRTGLEAELAEAYVP
jgi:hypothetical protein